MKYCNTPLMLPLTLLLLAANGVTAMSKAAKASKLGKSAKDNSGKSAKGKGGKSSKYGKSSRDLGFDPPQWSEFDGKVKSFDARYVGDYETIDTTEISDMYSQEGAVFLFDLGSFGSLIRRLGAVITLSEIRTIWYELSPIARENNGIIMKSVSGSLQIFFEKVSDGITGTRAMHLALLGRWMGKIILICGENNQESPDWCDDEDNYKNPRFFNTASIGGAYGNVLVIPNNGKPVDAYGVAVNNAYFAEEEAEHGESVIDEDALQSLLREVERNPGDPCFKGSIIPWTPGNFGIDHFITKYYDFACYYTVCFDAECKYS